MAWNEGDKGLQWEVVQTGETRRYCAWEGSDWRNMSVTGEQTDGYFWQGVTWKAWGWQGGGGAQCWWQGVRWTVWDWQGRQRCRYWWQVMQMWCSWQGVRCWVWFWKRRCETRLLFFFFFLLAVKAGSWGGRDFGRGRGEEFNSYRVGKGKGSAMREKGLGWEKKVMIYKVRGDIEGNKWGK